jgi:hypothetical protein
MTTTPGAAPAPYAIDTVSWPSDPSAISSLLARLPAEIGGGDRSDVIRDDTGVGPSISVAYYSGGDQEGYLAGDPHVIETAGVAAEPVSANQNQAIALYGIWAFAGPRCIDLQGSDELLSAIAIPEDAGPLAATRALEDVPSDRFVWFACTSTAGVDSGVRHKPDKYIYVIAWSGSGGFVWTAEGASHRDRQQLVEALVAAS